MSLDSLEDKRIDYTSRKWTIKTLKEHADSIGVKILSKDAKPDIVEKILAAEFSDEYSANSSPVSSVDSSPKSKVVNAKNPVKTLIRPTVSKLPPKAKVVVADSEEEPEKIVPAKISVSKLPPKKVVPVITEDKNEEEEIEEKEIIPVNRLPPKKTVAKKPVVVEEEESAHTEKKTLVPSRNVTPVEEKILPAKTIPPKITSKKTCTGTSKPIRGIPGKPCTAPVSLKFEYLFCAVHRDQYKKYLESKIDPKLSMSDVEACDIMDCYRVIAHPELLVEIKDISIPLHTSNVSLKYVFIDDVATAEISDEHIEIAKSLDICTEKIQNIRISQEESLNNIKNSLRE